MNKLEEWYFRVDHRVLGTRTVAIMLLANELILIATIQFISICYVVGVMFRELALPITAERDVDTDSYQKSKMDLAFSSIPRP